MYIGPTTPFWGFIQGVR